LLLYMTSGFHDRDNLLNTIILCVLKYIYRLIRPNTSQAYSTHCKAARIYMELRFGICMFYVMHRHIFFSDTHTCIHTHTYKMDLIIISRTKQNRCREWKFKMYLQAIYAYENKQLWPHEFSTCCRIVQFLSECQRTYSARNGIMTIFCV